MFRLAIRSNPAALSHRLVCAVLIAVAVPLAWTAAPRAARAADVVPAEIQAYQRLLDGFTVKDTSDVPKAAETGRSTFAGKSESLRDAAFLVFRAYWARVREAQEKACQAAQDDAETKNPNMKFSEFYERLTRDMAELSSSTLYVQGGLCTVPNSDGTFSVAERPGFFLAKFGTLVSPGVRDFLELEWTDRNRPWSKEGTLAVTWKELGDRVAAWEKHLDKYEKQPLRANAQAYYRAACRALLVGLPNSPVWDYETHEVTAEVRDALAKYAEAHAKQPSGKAVADELAIFKKCNFKVDDASMDALADLIVRLGLK